MNRTARSILTVALSGASCATPHTTHSKVVDYRKADFGGHGVYYQSHGTGSRAVVFVHGWACDHTFFRYQIPAFAGKTHVIALDLIGHGKSDAPQIEYTFDTLARSIDAVLRDADVNQCVLVGHSNGMPTIRQFYRLFPEKTLALVNLDGTLKPYYEDPGEAKKELAVFEGPQYLQAMDFYVKQMLTDRLPPEARQGILDTMKRTPQRVIVGGITATLDPAIWRDDPIRVPFQCLLAKQPFWDEAYAAYVKRLAPEVDIRIYDGVGHFLMMEKPDLVNAAMLEFLAKHGLLD